MSNSHKPLQPPQKTAIVGGPSAPPTNPRLPSGPPLVTRQASNKGVPAPAPSRTTSPGGNAEGGTMETPAPVEGEEESLVDEEGANSSGSVELLHLRDPEMLKEDPLPSPHPRAEKAVAHVNASPPSKVSAAGAALPSSPNISVVMDKSVMPLFSSIINPPPSEGKGSSIDFVDGVGSISAYVSASRDSRIFVFLAHQIPVHDEDVGSSLLRHHTVFDPHLDYDPLLQYRADGGLMPGKTAEETIQLRDVIIRWESPHRNFNWRSLASGI
ncbi:hypothetical protein K438DRAFT_1998422 [Mycena galopus ATCC 62051]|nr:hypothetical protein K438DRAFT_1998422 [Mycena galopus ATCC 62051]